MKHHLDFRGDIPFPAWLRTATLTVLVLSLLQIAYLIHREPLRQELQARVSSLALLPAPDARDSRHDPRLAEDYATMLRTSALLTRPVQRWMSCLNIPQGSPVQLESFDWQTASGVLELNLSLPERGALAEYQQTLAAPPRSCQLRLRQEEQEAGGLQRLRVQVSPMLEEAADGR